MSSRGQGEHTVIGAAVEPPPGHNHPAMFSKELIVPLADRIRGCRRVLDPFPGTGRIRSCRRRATVDRDRAGAGVGKVDDFPGPYRRQIVGDSLEVLPTFRAGTFDSVVTSPAYGNRMADKHDARDPCTHCTGRGVVDDAACKVCKGSGLSRRNTYRHRLGRALSDNNGGGLQWGQEYRDLHSSI